MTNGSGSRDPLPISAFEDQRLSHFLSAFIERDRHANNHRVDPNQRNNPQAHRIQIMGMNAHAVLRVIQWLERERDREQERSINEHTRQQALDGAIQRRPNLPSAGTPTNREAANPLGNQRRSAWDRLAGFMGRYATGGRLTPVQARIEETYGAVPSIRPAGESLADSMAQLQGAFASIAGDITRQTPVREPASVTVHSDEIVSDLSGSELEEIIRQEIVASADRRRQAASRQPRPEEDPTQDARPDLRIMPLGNEGFRELLNRDFSMLERNVLGNPVSEIVLTPRRFALGGNPDADTIQRLRDVAMGRVRRGPVDPSPASGSAPEPSRPVVAIPTGERIIDMED